MCSFIEKTPYLCMINSLKAKNGRKKQVITEYY